MSAFQFSSSSLSFPQSLTSLFSFATFTGSSRSNSLDPSPTPSFPDDDDPVDDVKKEKTSPKPVDSELDPFSLDDIQTPGNRSDWAKTPLPSTTKSTLKNPGKFSEMERDVMGLAFPFLFLNLSLNLKLKY